MRHCFVDRNAVDINFTSFRQCREAAQQKASAVICHCWSEN